MAKQNFWLIKSEPETYSVEHLKKDKKTWWEGVRNYQSRNFMMKDMRVGDQILFYHSNAEPTGIAGVAKVCALAKPDQTQFDKKSDFFEAKATPEKPTWFCVQVEFLSRFSEILPLSQIKNDQALATMPLLQKGQRLSVQPVEEKQFRHILELAKS